MISYSKFENTWITQSPPSLLSLTTTFHKITDYINVFLHKIKIQLWLWSHPNPFRQAIIIPLSGSCSLCLCGSKTENNIQKKNFVLKTHMNLTHIKKTLCTMDWVAERLTSLQTGQFWRTCYCPWFWTSQCEFSLASLHTWETSAWLWKNHKGFKFLSI